MRNVSGVRTAARTADRTGWSGVRGKRVLVTGGTRGLGEQIVRLLAAEGARVATCARGAGDLDVLARSLDTPVYTRALDVTEPEHLESFVAAVAKRFGGLDGVVACAGGSRGGRFEATDSEDWAATWEVNVGHAARLIRAAVPPPICPSTARRTRPRRTATEPADGIESSTGPRGRTPVTGTAPGCPAVTPRASK
ncbi:SDR family oxidoreductase [Streptomyces sp. NPDC005195]|uniref:SDR family oxidoreductase n=1 Tax=Streptomyces sp. NPDC005195 TaxID=3154561 RepID=UPI0033B71C51